MIGIISINLAMLILKMVVNLLDSKFLYPGYEFLFFFKPFDVLPIWYLFDCIISSYSRVVAYLSHFSILSTFSSMSLFSCFSPLMSDFSSSVLTSFSLFHVFLSAWRTLSNFCVYNQNKEFKKLWNKNKKAAIINSKCSSCYFKISHGSKKKKKKFPPST